MFSPMAVVRNAWKVCEGRCTHFNAFRHCGSVAFNVIEEFASGSFDSVNCFTCEDNSWHFNPKWSRRQMIKSIFDYVDAFFNFIHANIHSCPSVASSF